MTRRYFFQSLARTAGVFSLDQVAQAQSLPVEFVNVAREAGLRTTTIFGGEKRNRYLLETTGCGVCFFDYDNDGWLDLFLVNGTRFEAKWAPGTAPVSRLFKNNRDGTFTDVTVKAGVARTGWGQGVCAGDYNNDGFDDLFVTYWGENSLWRNNGDGTFTDVARDAGVGTGGGKRNRWNTGCAFVDYDRDGKLDLFVAAYIDFDLKTVPVPESGNCLYKGLRVACGPPGLQGAKNLLFQNNGDGTFTDVSEEAGIWKTPGTYGLGVVVSDFDNDGWPDIYVANDSTSSALYRNNRDGTFSEIAIEAGVAYSPDGKPQAGMGVSAADYDRDGFFDLVKTNFAGDTSSLYRNLGKNTFEDQTLQAGLGVNTRFLGWGAAFVDIDNDGLPDIVLSNGHVYPEVGDSDSEAGYRQRKVAYQNLGNGRFKDISQLLGPGMNEAAAGRGMAVGDFDNDGDLDIAVNTINGPPQLLRCDSRTGNGWLKVKCVGTRSNRSGIGARVYCTPAGGKRQMDEVRSGSSYLSQSDLRVHFGLGKAGTADIEVHWPSGQIDKRAGVKANQILRVVETETKSQVTVMLFVRTDCAISDGYAGELERLNGKYTPRGVLFLTVYSSATELHEEIARHHTRLKLPGQWLPDTDQNYAKRLGVRVTPEAVVIANNRLVYRGRIDDRWVDANQSREVTRRDLEEAIEAGLAGRPVAMALTQAVGCPLDWLP